MDIIDLALSIAVEAHAGLTDRDGEAYILHPLQVGLMGSTDEERCAGFLHDVLEDTPVTAQELLDKGIPAGVVKALGLLTHSKGTDYYDYVQHIIDSHNPIALKVKYNDLQHNYARGKAYPDLQKKHGKALQMVRAAVEARNRVVKYEATAGLAYAAFAAGCFWGVQHHFEKVPGVKRTLVGYTGGTQLQPTYEQVRAQQTDHLEAVLVEFDSNEVNFSDLSKLFFEIHDPAQTDGQGADKGRQYLSAVFYAADLQKTVTEELADTLRSKGYEVNTMVRPLGDFWIAEEYHQHYYDNTGGSPYCHVRERKF